MAQAKDTLPEDPRAAEQEIRELTDEIHELNHAYYDLDNPLASDAYYDSLTQRLKALVAAFPDLAPEDSPLERVGGEADRRFQRVEHRVPMLSLNDVFSLEDVTEFIEQVGRAYPDTDYIVEEKIDGLSLALRYENGRFTQALTRGDGRHYGEDVTANARQLDGVPLKLAADLPYLEVRAEVYFPLDRFKALNEQRESMGEELFANPRNAAAGTLRQLDPSLVKARGLSLFVFNLQMIEGKRLATHGETLDFLAEQGFPVSPHWVKVDNAADVYAAIEAIQDRKGELNYAIDGAVVKVDSLDEREALGATAKAPRWAVAYKYPPEVKETVLREVRWQVGRSGRVTPQAIFDAVQLAGTTVQRATLNNPDYIDALDLRVGDTIRVVKSGEIIPQVLSVNKDKRPDDAVAVTPPANCPVCEADTERIGADIVCSNPACPAKQKRKFEYFASKNAMDIDGLGPSTVESLIEDFQLTSIADLYRLHDKRDELIEKGHIGREKRVDNLLTAIERSKDNDLARLITGIGIPGIGRENARVLVRALPSIEAIRDASIEELQAIDGLGPVLAANVYEFFKKDETLELLADMESVGFDFTAQEASQEAPQTLDGKRFVITGSFEDRTRNELKALIEEHGGQVTGSVSSKTDYLLLGENPGSKKQKADDLGVPSIDLAALRELLGGQ